ncbi:MAG: hypothetical protein EBE86_006780 [Hormoscilla sp. GUM202]|nr:hypothetical protein [Hormoscilla sp. GUM202]
MSGITLVRPYTNLRSPAPVLFQPQGYAPVSCSLGSRSGRHPIAPISLPYLTTLMSPVIFELLRELLRNVENPDSPLVELQKIKLSSDMRFGENDRDRGWHKIF